MTLKNEKLRGAYSKQPLLLVLCQLFLVILVVREFEIEKSRGLAELLYAVASGFVVFVATPFRFRLPIFLLLSLAICVFVVGWMNTAWVWGLGGALIGLCHLPIPFPARLTLLIVAALGLAYFRINLDLPFWPVLGSMFMFRLMIYLRELKREEPGTPLSMRLAYFFMLPNACFPFYPIVDYRTFSQSWFKQPADEIAQQGVHWIVRGIMHLLLYRAIKYFLLPSPEEIRTAGGVALFLATNYMLYLRVSGTFHIITGILHLFGFALPRTHDNYFLASSFTDIWRRINIYWKVFLEKMFFYPAFFRMRRYGVQKALMGATAFVFLVTWAMHSYQVFWLVGEFPVGRNEIALWGLAGVVVTTNVLMDYRRDRAKKRIPQTPTFLHAAQKSLQVMSVFTCVAIFWACWTMPGFVPGLTVIATNTQGFWSDSWKIFAALSAVFIIGTVAQLLRRTRLSPTSELLTSNLLSRDVMVNCVVMIALLVFSTPWFTDAFDLKTREKIVNMQREMQTAAEVARDVQGYYEQLANVNSQADPLIGAEQSTASRDSMIFMDLTRSRDDLLDLELIPGWKGTLVGSPLTINSYGMRNPPTSKAKPPKTYRIAVVGSSITMGYGVKDDEAFARLLEAKFNEAIPPGGPHVEVLNFGIGQYYALHVAASLRTKVFDFQPDAVYFIAHQGEFYGPPRHVSAHWEKGHHLLYPCLDQIIKEAGITRDSSQGTVDVLLQQRAAELTTCIYRGITQDCRQRGILPVWIFIPIPAVFELTVDEQPIVKAAVDAGFEVIDLRNWSKGTNPDSIKLARGEHHLNASGHQLLAEKIWEAIRENSLLSAPLKQTTKQVE